MGEGRKYTFLNEKIKKIIKKKTVSRNATPNTQIWVWPSTPVKDQWRTLRPQAVSDSGQWQIDFAI